MKDDSTSEGPILQADQIRFCYEASDFNLGPIELSLSHGETVGVVGPNGSGKTTLLRLLSGFLRPTSGQVHLNGMDIRRVGTRKLAKAVAFVPHQTPSTFPYRAFEIVLMGRLPHLSVLRSERREDESIAEAAMVATDTSHLKERYFNELSGGERQRVMLAMALTQRPKVLLLDEPTSHLDISHVIRVFDALAAAVRRDNLSVIAVLHDLNLASEYCERLVLMEKGRVAAKGAPSEVLSAENVKRVFDTEVAIGENPSTGAAFVFPVPGHR